jgi:hypothetical protein
MWYLDVGNKDFSQNMVNGFQFGRSGDTPVVGDWDGDGRTDVGVFRPSTDMWYLDVGNKDFSQNMVNGFQFGGSGDTPVVGDWDGEGRTDVGTFRPSTGEWYLDVGNKDFSQNMVNGLQFGRPGDIPVVGDWDGGERISLGVFRPGDSTWSLTFNPPANPTRLAIDPNDLSSAVAPDGSPITSSHTIHLTGNGAPGKQYLIGTNAPHDPSNALQVRAGADGIFHVTLTNVPSDNTKYYWAHAIGVAEDGRTGFPWTPNVAFSVHDPPSPTLVIITHGQEKPLTDGRGVFQWEHDMATAIHNDMKQTAGPATELKVLYVDWSTLGANTAPAQIVANQILQITSDREYGGKPWNIITFGHSRGTIFNDVMLRDLNIPAHPDRIGVVWEIMLDPTATTLLPAHDSFPKSKPPGVDREVDYDDGYHLTGGFTALATWGLSEGAVVDGNRLQGSGNADPISGAEYKNLRVEVGRYAKLNPSLFGSYLVPNTAFKAHAAVTEVYRTNPYTQSDGTQTNLLDADIAAFLKRTDGGKTPTSPIGKFSESVSSPERDTLFHPVTIINTAPSTKTPAKK